jgi:hypothetical protein
MVEIRTARDGRDTLIASVHGRVSDGRRIATILDARKEVFAHVTKTLNAATAIVDSARPCYVLTSTRSGVQWLLDGNFREHAVHVTNEQKEILADTEPSVMKFDPSGSYYKLRVNEGVDVSLVLCALLSISEMELS